MPRTQKLGLLLILALLIAVAIIWYFTLTTVRPHALTVSFLDIGQGDAIFIESPSGTQVLVDGSASSIVLRELAGVMPLTDRTIDMIIATHPDADHIGGLIDVLERYDVARIMESSVLGDTPIWERFRESADAENAERATALRGQIIDIGGGAYLEVLFPDRLLPEAETNLASVVARLVYGSTSFLLTGDSPQAIEQYLVSLDREHLASTVLKAGHHGSKTSTSPLFAGYVNPQFAVISRGCDNSYGHPNQEVLASLAKFEAEVLDTCTDGRATFVSDGKSVRRH